MQIAPWGKQQQQQTLHTAFTAGRCSCCSWQRLAGGVAGRPLCKNISGLPTYALVDLRLWEAHWQSQVSEGGQSLCVGSCRLSSWRLPSGRVLQADRCAVVVEGGPPISTSVHACAVAINCTVAGV